MNVDRKMNKEESTKIIYVGNPVSKHVSQLLGLKIKRLKLVAKGLINS